MDSIVEHIPRVSQSDASEETEEEAEGPVKVAVVGKPNVGKSSFINAILNEERSIVDDTPERHATRLISSSNGKSSTMC